MSLNIRDVGIILSVKKYSESSLIVQILSKEHGIYSGFVKCAIANKKNSAIYQVANLVEFNWKSKTVDNLGIFKIELIKSHLAKIIFNNLKLSCVTAIFEVIKSNILEREPHQDLYGELINFLSGVDDESQKFLSSYVKLELNLLQILGYGIDLSSCALTGKKDDLYYISPKSGRAACKDAGLEYKDKLLRLPEFLTNQNAQINNEDLRLGLNLTSYFLKKCLIADNSKFFELRSKIVSISAIL
jgi:DNA repair protein RecO (recombination protein O)